MKKVLKRVVLCVMAVVCIIAEFPQLSVHAATNNADTSGNLHNWGYVTMDDEWIYYVCRKESTFRSWQEDGSVVTKVFNIGDICKERKDGTETIKVVSPGTSYVRNLFVSDGWLYYIKTLEKYGATYAIRLYRVRVNGEDNQCLSKDNVYFAELNENDGRIYYIKATPRKYSIYRINKDGTQKTKIIDSDILVDEFCVSGNWIYYSYNGCLCKIKTNGKSKKNLIVPKYLNNLEGCQVSDGWVYYKTKTKKLYRVRTDGTKNQKIKSHVLDFNVTNGWIYYSTDTKGLYKIKVDGTRKQKLSSLRSEGINIVGNKIYCLGVERVNNALYRYSYIINNDGTEYQRGWLHYEMEE